MRVSFLKIDTETSAFETETVSLSFETECEKLLMVETETETRKWTIFETESTRDQPLDVKTETKSLADLRMAMGLVAQ